MPLPDSYEHGVQDSIMKGKVIAATDNITLPDYEAYSVVVVTNASTKAVTLPSAASAKDRIIKIKQGGAGVVQIKTVASEETIDGLDCSSSGLLLAQTGDWVTVISTGSVWYILDKYCPQKIVASATDPSTTLALKQLADHIVVEMSPTGAVDCTLPAGNSWSAARKVFTIKQMVGTNFATVKSTSGTLDGTPAGTGKAFNAQWEGLSLVSDGTNYIIIAEVFYD